MLNRKSFSPKCGKVIFFLNVKKLFYRKGLVAEAKTSFHPRGCGFEPHCNIGLNQIEQKKFQLFLIKCISNKCFSTKNNISTNLLFLSQKFPKKNCKKLWAKRDVAKLQHFISFQKKTIDRQSHPTIFDSPDIQ